MKLRSIYLICEQHYDTVNNFSAAEVSVLSRTMYNISDWLSYMEMLLQLKKINILTERSEKVIESVPEYYRTKDEFRLDDQEWNLVRNANLELKRTMGFVIELYESMGLSTEEKVGIDIKIPQCSDISEYVSYISDLEYIFTKCPFLESKDEKWIFDNVDVGSDWITLLVEFSAAGAVASVLLNNLAAFIDKCIIIRSHYLSTQKQKIELENEKENEEYKQSVTKYLDSIYAKAVDNAIKEMEEISGYTVKNDDGDDKGRIQEAFNRMGKLIDKGVQIYSTIDSPEETKLLFEPLEMHYEKIEDKLKFLVKKEDKE